VGTSGVSGFERPVSLEDLYNWDKCTGLLAAQEPWWTPGTASSYHPMTVGFLVGEVMRRITGRRFGRFFADEIAGPLGADFHIGLARSEFARVSNVVPWPTLDVTGGADPGSVSFKTNSNSDLDFHGIEVPDGDRLHGDLRGGSQNMGSLPWSARARHQYQREVPEQGKNGPSWGEVGPL
jgi:CubicO group peptidase (beta-lactamase class C family)